VGSTSRNIKGGGKMTITPQANNPQSINEAQRSVWNRAAATYLQDFGGLFPEAVGPLLDAARVGDGTQVLDVATGPGTIAAVAAARGARVTGVDFAEDMIDEARRRNPSIEFRVGDAAALPFDDATFDAVVIGFGLHHMAEPLKALTEAKRVLKPGGRVAFTVWDAPEKLEAFGIALGAVGSHVQPEAAPGENPPLLGQAEEGLLTGAAIEAGFIETTFERLPLVWELPSSEALYEAFRAFANLDALPDDAREAIHADIVAGASKYERDGLLHIPNPAVLVSASRP
jgi:SAM-dependent methyltransferase